MYQELNSLLISSVDGEGIWYLHILLVDLKLSKALFITVAKIDTNLSTRGR